MFSGKGILAIVLVVIVGASSHGMAEWLTEPGAGIELSEWEERVSSLLTRNFGQELSNKSINRDDIKKMQGVVRELIAANPERPKLYLIMAQLYSAEVERIIDSQKKNGADLATIRASSDYSSTVEKIDEFYEKALNLSDGALSVEQLQPMTLTSSADIQVQAYRRIMNIFEEGGSAHFAGTEHGVPEDFLYNTYGKIVSAYVEEGRFQEALSVLGEMRPQFPRAIAEIDAAIHRVQSFSHETLDGEDVKP